MMLSLVTPVIAVIVGASVGDESFPPQILFGGFLILGGIALILVKTDRRKMEPVDFHLTT
jgi:drug/metabolite transporter (DMT)-like permease